MGLTLKTNKKIVEDRMVGKHEIYREDILASDIYAAERSVRRNEVVVIKKDRRIEVGPVASFYFENYATMWHQIHEMLFIEKGGEERRSSLFWRYTNLLLCEWWWCTRRRRRRNFFSKG